MRCHCEKRVFVVIELNMQSACSRDTYFVYYYFWGVALVCTFILVSENRMIEFLLEMAYCVISSEWLAVLFLVGIILKLCMTRCSCFSSIFCILSSVDINYHCGIMCLSYC